MVSTRRKSGGVPKAAISPRTVWIVAAFVLLVLSLSILGNSMTKPIGRDEQMYCTGGVLLAEGKAIYRDFSYPAQMPCHPLLYAMLFRISGTSHYLLTGRLVSSVCDVLVVLCIIGVYLHVFGSLRLSGILLGLAAAVLYLFNPSVDYANGYAWNHDVVILCVASSFWLFATTDFKGKYRHVRIAAIGALLTLATFMRITTAMAGLVFFVILFIRPARSLKDRLYSALSFLAAAAVVAAWPVWVIIRAWRPFLLNLFRIPRLYGTWLESIHMVHNKWHLTFTGLTKPGYLVLILALLYLCVAVVLLRRRAKMPTAHNAALAALLVAAFFVIAFIPPTMWRQYLAVPVPFLVIFLAYPLRYLRGLAENAGQKVHFKAASVVTAGAVLIAVVSNPVVLYHAVAAIVPESWVPLALHDVSVDIAARTQPPKRALTLAPLFALEGGCEVYDELSAGAIVYRIADRLSADERRITHTAGPKTLAGLLAESPPSVVIAGLEMDRLEQPMVEAAVKSDWARQLYEDGPTVYFPP